MGAGAGLYVYDVVVKMFTFAISSSSTDEFLFKIYNVNGQHGQEGKRVSQYQIS